MARATLYDHLILVAGVVLMTGPLVLVAWSLAAELGLSGLTRVFGDVWRDGPQRYGIPGKDMMANSLIIAVGLAVLKTTVAMLAAYALLFFRIRYARAILGVVLLSLFLPIESRVLPTFLVTDRLNLLNTYTGMILPVSATGLGLLVFHQFLKGFPPEIVEAARIDGAGPVKVLRDMVVPLSVPMMAALFAIAFVLGWNQYMWPIMVNTTDLTHDTLVRGIGAAGVGSAEGQALALLALIPPGLVVLALQRWLVQAVAAGIR